MPFTNWMREIVVKGKLASQRHCFGKRYLVVWLFSSQRFNGSRLPSRQGLATGSNELPNLVCINECYANGMLG